jgi:hypothetical protein
MLYLNRESSVTYKYNLIRKLNSWCVYRWIPNLNTSLVQVSLPAAFVSYGLDERGGGVFRFAYHGYHFLL